MLNELRVQYATRAQSRVPERAVGHRPGDQRHRRRQLRRPDRRRSPTPASASPRTCCRSTTTSTLLRGDHALKAGVDMQCVADTRTSAAGAALHVPERRGLPGGARAARTASATPASRSTSACPTSEYNTEPVRLLRAGRLARCRRTSRCSTACATTSTACRTADPERAGRDLARLPDRQEQLRAAGRRGVDARRDTPLGGARQHRPDVRPDAATRSTSRRCRTTAPTRAPSATFTPTQAGAPAFPAVLERRRRRARRTSRATVDPGLQGRAHRGRTTCSSSARSAIATRSSVGASYVKGYNLPVVTNINLINPIGTLADGRPIFSTAVNAATRVDPRYNVINSVAVDRRVDLQEHDAAVHAPQRQRHRLRLRLHARQERGQRADHQRAVGAGRRRPLRPDQPRSRPRPEHPRPAPHLHRQHRRDAAASSADGAVRRDPEQQRVRRRACSSPAASR